MVNILKNMTNLREVKTVVMTGKKNYDGLASRQLEGIP